MKFLLLLMGFVALWLTFPQADAGKNKLVKRVKSLETLLKDIKEQSDATQDDVQETKEEIGAIKDDIRQINSSTYSCAVSSGRPAANCNDILLKNPASQSGEYTITASNDVEITVYCEFYELNGYMFLSKEALSSLTSLDGLYSITDHALIRIQYKNGEQHDIEVAQLSAFEHRYPLSFQLNSYIGYKRPINHDMAPYIYLGFLPSERASLKSAYSSINPTQGYRAGGADIKFVNCDRNPNSYIAFFANAGNIAEDGYFKRCCNENVVRAWFQNAQLVPNDRYLKQNYFMAHEMHMGGCGGYFTSSHAVNYAITGATIGLGFEIKSDNCASSDD